MALGPDSAKQIKHFEGKIDRMLLSEEVDETKTVEICLSSNEVSKVVQQNLIAVYEEAGWKRVIFKVDNRTIILYKE